jgi:hypothetical protein
MLQDDTGYQTVKELRMNPRDSSLSCLVLFLLFGASCDLSHTPTPADEIQSVSFLDKGAVVPDPICTLVTVSQDSIRLAAYQTADTIRAWSSLLVPEDFSHLVTIIRDNNLIGSPDPALPPGVTGCVGHQGMRIVFVQGVRLDTVNISGFLWCTRNRVHWPPGLLSLVSFEDSLINKYKP